MEAPKRLEDSILESAAPTKDGIDAFRHGDFARCIELLNIVIDRYSKDWQARLYLAMAHYSLGDIYTGAVHFRYLERHCPNDDIRAKAHHALVAMEADLEVTPQIRATATRKIKATTKTDRNKKKKK